jgi:NAD-dependent deacetylase
MGTEETRPSSEASSTHRKKSEPDIYEEINLRVKQKLKEQREADEKLQNEREAKRQIEKSRHDEILASTQATIAKNKEVLESTRGTLERLQGVINGVKETEQKFKDFQNAFGEIMSRSLNKCFGIFGGDVEELKKKHGAPKESSIEEVASAIAAASSISIITGAGVSAESGVFTYKNNAETWEIDGNQLSLQEVMNIDILKGYPLEFWQNIQYNRIRFGSCSPNNVHYSLADLMFLFRSKGKKASLITQNIDGFDRSILGNDPDFYEIHGNTNLMRCMFECCDELFPCPDLNEYISTIPLCPLCGAISRPNVLLYGEGYTEKWYRAETASKAVKESDLLIVIGTQIKCGFPAERVSEFCNSDKTIIEINVEPVIQYGKVLVLPSTCGQVFPPIVEVARNMNR